MKAGKGAAAPEGAADGGDSADFRCLVRATDGKRKFSTAVRARAQHRALSPRSHSRSVRTLY
jgi:hypothetical protein